MNIGIMCGSLLYFVEYLFAFRVIGSTATRQHQLAIVPPFDHLIGSNDAQWVFQTIETRDLCNYRAIRINPIFFQHALNCHLVKRFVFVA